MMKKVVSFSTGGSNTRTSDSQRISAAPTATYKKGVRGFASFTEEHIPTITLCTGNIDHYINI